MAISGPDAIAGADSVEEKNGNSQDLLWFALGERI